MKPLRIIASLALLPLVHLGAALLVAQESPTVPPSQDGEPAAGQPAAAADAPAEEQPKEALDLPEGGQPDPGAVAEPVLPAPTPPPIVIPANPLDWLVVMDPASGGPRPLKGISLFADRRRKATDSAPKWETEQKNALQDGVRITDGLMTPNPEGLRSKLASFIGRTPTTYGVLQEIVEVIQEHYNSHHRPMTHVYIPKQSTYSDRVVISIIEGRVGETVILTEADVLAKPESSRSLAEKSFVERMEAEKSWWNSWYDNPYRAADVAGELLPRAKELQGRIVDTEEIKAQVTGMNRSPWVRLNRPVEHPFRDVTVNFSQPEANVLGTTDLAFEVHDRRPLKFFTGVDNSLTDITGENRIFLGAAWYDAFLLGKSHQFGAQIFSGLDYDEMAGVSLNYMIPWQDLHYDQFTEVFASYVASQVDVSLGGLTTDSVGRSYIFGARHYFELPELWGATDLSMPLLDANPRSWAQKKREAFGLHHEVGAGFDFKKTDNNLEFGGSTVSESPADILQFVLDYNARQTDPTVETSLLTQLFISPGDITADNSSEDYAPLRYDADASYVYGRVRLEREQDLPFAGMMAKGALTGQYSSSNLLASEQLGLGGFYSVRGYPERALRGDIGFILNLELYSPEFHPCRDWFKWGKDDSLRFLTFFDLAHGESVDENPADPLDDAADLMSVGLGLRYEFSDMLRLRLDYGFRLKDLPAAAGNEDNGAVHFGLIFVF